MSACSLFACLKARDEQQCLRLLTTHGASLVHSTEEQHNQTPLHVACQLGLPAVVDLLLALNANVNALTHDSSTPLHYASTSGSLAVVEALLRHNADINAANSHLRHPLSIACRKWPEIAQLLIEQHADIQESYAPHSPLHIACLFGLQCTVLLLLQRRANVHARNVRHDTPLHNACGKGLGDIAVQLLEHGADIDARNNQHLTPLHFACAMNCGNVATLLIERNANLHATDARGSTPLHHACSKKCTSVALTLIELGASMHSINVCLASSLTISHPDSLGVRWCVGCCSSMV
jgi:ankyrin repeat protein